MVSVLGLLVLGGIGVGVAALVVYMVHLDSVIHAQFEGKRWSVPARVYARPLELYAGMALSADQFTSELGLLNYRNLEQANGAGTYSREGKSFDLVTRDFTFWDGQELSRHVRVTFDKGSLQELNSLDEKEAPGLLRMEPAQIAGIYPAQAEDRILIKREDIPPVLVDALIAMEDRDFYQHMGIDPVGIARAIIANLKAGRTVQGGSTLTQQLVKNFFLTNERTLKRKFNEMLMALLVDWRYTKDEILEAYGNEVYLGQDGDRAIHGLGLASRFYFDRPLQELDLHHIALLVGMVRGPSLYDPRRHPQRARVRRALVLDVMVGQGLISAEDAAIAKQMPLEVSPSPPGGVTSYPAFLDLVKRQLREDYKQEDLTSEGLKIFTTLDPLVQATAEKALIEGLPRLEKRAGLKTGQLQGATVIADTQNGEVQAVVGGRDVRMAGFNRALNAKRPAGSLLKPAIYLTALERPNRYTLATLLDDSRPVVYRDNAGNTWSPDNYDKRYHGRVMLQDALARSYNVSTARLGLDLDVIQVIKTLQRLGINREMQPYPALLLGAVDLAPLEVAQMYESFASGGFRIPLRAIREVTASDDEPLQRYPLNVKKVIEPGPAYLITYAMQRVVTSGTAKAISKRLPKHLGIAGKTGTTDDSRDSWFAGFSGNILSVVWLGRDDNKPIRLSGSTGALRVWIDIMEDLNLMPLELQPPADVVTMSIDPRSGLLAGRSCGGTQSVPFLDGSAPRYAASCSSGVASRGEPSNAQAEDNVDTGRTAAVSAPVVPRQPPPQKPAAESNSIRDFFRRLLE